MPSAILVTAAGTMTLLLTPCCGAFDRGDVGQPDHARLGHRIVRHLVVAVETADRRGEHDAAVPGLAHQRKRRAHNVEGAAQVNVDHGLEVVVGHLLQRRPANVSGVVNEDVDAAVVVQCRVDDRLAARRGRHRLGAGDGIAARRGDFAHHLVGGRGVGAVTGEAAAGIVDDDLRALRRQQQGVRAAQPPAAAGDDGDPVVESQVSHLFSEHQAFQVAFVAPLLSKSSNA